MQVRTELPPGLRPARADPEKLQRVLFNLIQNAIRHTPADGSVVVRAAPADDAVEIEVADTGAGIAADERDRVFEPFFRGGADAARTSDGAGLGLAISRAIVEAHGGRIWLEDAPAGTCGPLLDSVHKLTSGYAAGADGPPAALAPAARRGGAARLQARFRP